MKGHNQPAPVPPPVIPLVLLLAFGGSVTVIWRRLAAKQRRLALERETVLARITEVGRYSKLLREIAGMPAEGGLPLGRFQPALLPEVVKALADYRLKELKLIADDPDLSYQTKALVTPRLFHTYDDFLHHADSQRPKRGEHVSSGASFGRDTPDLPGYLRHIRKHDPDFADWLEKPHEAAIDLRSFWTSVYVTGETQSGKSYFSENIFYELAKLEKTGIWVFDPHGQLARNVAHWKANLGRNVFFFDINLDSGRLPVYNPFDQLPDTKPETLDVVTEEQVSAFAAVVAGETPVTGIMKACLASCIHLMLALPTGSLQELYRLMDDERNEDLVAAGARLQNHQHAEFFRYDFGKKKLHATKDAIATRVSSFLSSSILYRLTNGQSTFKVHEMFNTPGVYVFNFGKGLIGETASTMLGRLLMAQLQASAFKREKDGLTEEKVPTRNYALIDECHNFVNASTGDIAAETRKYGLALFLAQQFVGQKIDLGLMEGLLTNTPLKFTGVGALKTYRKVAEAQNVDAEGFQGLKPRLFHVARRGSAPFIACAPPDLAGRELRMTNEEWRAFRADQLARYYRPSGSQDAPESPETPSGVQSGAEPAVTHQRPPQRPRGGGAIASTLKAMRRALAWEEGEPPNQLLPPEPPEEEAYQPEEEVSPGMFVSVPEPDPPPKKKRKPPKYS